MNAARVHLSRSSLEDHPGRMEVPPSIQSGANPGQRRNRLQGWRHAWWNTLSWCSNARMISVENGSAWWDETTGCPMPSKMRLSDSFPMPSRGILSSVHRNAAFMDFQPTALLIPAPQTSSHVICQQASVSLFILGILQCPRQHWTNSFHVHSGYFFKAEHSNWTAYRILLWCLDGVRNMPRCFTGVQARLRELGPQSLYIAVTTCCTWFYEKLHTKWVLRPRLWTLYRVLLL